MKIRSEGAKRRADWGERRVEARRRTRQSVEGRRTRVRPKMPTIGANCDTFHGNSGSGAFLKRTQRVVGILIGGQPDVDRLRSGWARHEAILPIGPILDEIRQKIANLEDRGIVLEN